MISSWGSVGIEMSDTKRRAAICTMGCKVNTYESQGMTELLEKAGYEIVPFSEPADVYIINTCTVTQIAARKSRQMIHRARHLSPEAVVIAAGCYVDRDDSLIQEIYAQEDEGKSLTLGDGIYEVKRIFSDGIMEPVRTCHAIDDPFEVMDPEEVYDTIFNAEAQDFEDNFFEEVYDSDFDDEEKDLNR